MNTTAVPVTVDERERDMLAFDRGWQAAHAWLTPGSTVVGIGARIDAEHERMLDHRRRTAQAWTALDDAEEDPAGLTRVRELYGLHPFGPRCTPACREGVQ